MKRLSQSQIGVELKLASETAQSGRLNDSIERIDRVLRTNPDCSDANYLKGTILAALQRLPEALSSMEAVLQATPNHAEALRWAAQLSMHIRIPDKPERYARRLVRIQPSNDRALFLLSITQSLSGRWLDSLESIDAALAVRPDELDYIVGRAQLLVKLRLNRLAIEWYRKALEVRYEPQFARELAEVLLEEGQVSEALELLRRVEDSVPPSAVPVVLLGRAYTEAHDFEKAEPYWEKAKLQQRDQTALTVARAKSEVAAGRIEEAENLLRVQLAGDPKGYALYGMLAQIHRATPADATTVEAMERLLREESMHAVERQTLHYALGKCYDDLGEFERAMSCFDEANRLRSVFSPNGLRFDRAEWRANIDSQIQFFTAKRIAELSREGLDAPQLLLVMGMIRSGTTLTEQILSSHSQIRDAGEVSFWSEHFSSVFNRDRSRFDPGAASRLGRAYRSTLESGDPSVRRVIDKNPLNVLVAAGLHCILPTAKMLHIRRHPVDTLLSIWMTPMTTGLQFISDREDIVFAYREYARLADHLQEVLPPEQFMTVRYEDITGQPKLTIANMLTFVGLEWEDAVLHPDQNVRTVRTPSVYQVRQPIHTKSQAKWRNYERWLGPFAEFL
ncbi:MAG: sulfotransferase [Fimbriimonas sp.]|nr:sulfotransferase [Fimbriimonas sp.]